ncbi:MAG: hypothetical protein AAF928_13425 [Myxococcota bacterium]
MTRDDPEASPDDAASDDAAGPTGPTSAPERLEPLDPVADTSTSLDGNIVASVTAPPVPPRLKRLIVGTTATLVAVAIAARAAFPYLLVHHPLLLLVLNPKTSHMVLVAPQVELWSFLAVVTPRRMLSLVLLFGLGASYGRTAITWAKQRHPRFARLIDLIDGLFARYGLLVVLFLPIHTVCGLAGALRVSFGRFLVAILPGQLLLGIATYYLGDSLSDWIRPLTEWLSRHIVLATAVSVVSVIAYQAFSRARKKGQASPPTPERPSSP